MYCMYKVCSNTQHNIFSTIFSKTTAGRLFRRVEILAIFNYGCPVGHFLCKYLSVDTKIILLTELYRKLLLLYRLTLFRWLPFWIYANHGFSPELPHRQELDLTSTVSNQYKSTKKPYSTNNFRVP